MEGCETGFLCALSLQGVGMFSKERTSATRPLRISPLNSGSAIALLPTESIGGHLRGRRYRLI